MDGESESSRTGSIVSAVPSTWKDDVPQKLVDTFWKSFNSKYPGRVLKALPYRPGKTASQPISNIAHGEAALDSYDRAKRECEHAVDRIVKQCLRINQKYTDPHFDIERDLKSGQRNFLDGLQGVNSEMKPKGVKRVTDIFEKPEFYVNNATASDVRQGNDGDCWLMAALCTLGNMPGLIDRVCVARNEKVGVYGFVFYRDGEWRHTIIDDKLYLRAPDYEDAAWEREVWDDIGRADTELNYRKTWQTGSRALYFAQCSDDNETWLPLLEKAYAKAHGDYSSIEGGFVGEAVEDLTGGVTSEIMARDILDKERFWNEDLMNVNKKFVFGCATGLYGSWLYPQYYGSKERSGIHECHAYSVMDAKEINGKRLLRLRNPWGHKEWSGPWSDGSEQWTPEWMNILQHKFGNDGIFWISYEDFLLKYEHIDRTRLFGEGWTVAQKWTSLHVPWALEYHKTKFVIKVAKEGPVVIVLSQLDERYFKGLEGQYKFHLQFRLEKEGEEDYVIRNQNNIYMTRSVSTDITLEPGTYTVFVRVKATQFSDPPPEDVIREKASKQREKLVQIGHSYDLAHAKGVELESEEEEAERKRREKEKKAALKKKERDRAEAQLKKRWKRDKKIAARENRKAKRAARATEQRETKLQAKNDKKLKEGGKKVGQVVESDAERTDGSNREGGEEAAETPKAVNLENKNEGLTPLTGDANGKLEGKATENNDKDMESSEVPNQGKEVRAEEDNKMKGEDLKPSTEDAKVKEVQKGEDMEREDEENIESHADSENASDKEKREIEMSTTSKLAKGTENEKQRNEHPGMPEENTESLPQISQKLETDSDTDSGSVFEFDSEIDMSPTEESESDSEEHEKDDDDSNDGEYSVKPPWNAVCVVGLRVCSKDRDLTVSIVKPKPWQEHIEVRRDCDDPAVE
ncbi:calpain-9 [Histoplasma capsulatum G186AR]|uniref:Calpain-9 n=1 Tax=Ajellomyces capsulatus TaxID=5037 RepID=A0A8H7YZP1_AJECA|nr:calpain-9 [Histoplasma capsulatum]QSS67300.1 calpain-9 [Histoplasma capsulatum G186AR]